MDRNVLINPDIRANRISSVRVPAECGGLGVNCRKSYGMEPALRRRSVKNRVADLFVGTAGVKQSILSHIDLFSGMEDQC